MNIQVRKPANQCAKPALVDVYPPFRERIARFREIAATDPEAAAGIFAEAQLVAQAFWAGVDYACGAEE